MSIINVVDIAHVRFSAPDLTRMRTFLREFGLHAEFFEDGRLYARAADGIPFNHVTEQGRPGFKGLALRADSIADLETLATAEATEVTTLDTPGGGMCVKLTDPDGIPVEVVAGQSKAPAINPPVAAHRNSATDKPRHSTPVRLVAGPSHVQRLGHCVLNVRDFRASERWYKERFGFITSDEIEAAEGLAIGAFMRCDRGEQPVDHHTLFLNELPQRKGFMHAAFEVASIDDLMLGHTHLKANKRRAAWGVGRHVLGSQIFDYWKDPWGHELEHWTDGDLFTASDRSSTASTDDLLAVQWGAENPIFTGVFAPSPATIRFLLSRSLRLKQFFTRRDRETL